MYPKHNLLPDIKYVCAGSQLWKINLLVCFKLGSSYSVPIITVGRYCFTFNVKNTSNM